MPCGLLTAQDRAALHMHAHREPSIDVSGQAAERRCRVRRLQDCMDAAASTAPDVRTENGVEHSNASRTLRPLIKAIEMVFGSAAALSATFGYKAGASLQLPGLSVRT